MLEAGIKISSFSAISAVPVTHMKQIVWRIFLFAVHKFRMINIKKKIPLHYRRAHREYLRGVKEGERLTLRIHKMFVSKNHVIKLVS